MLAKYEHKVLFGSQHLSLHKYKNLHNLLHWHDEHELIYIESGTAEVLASNSVYSLCAGQCVWVSSGDVHYIAGSGESEILVIKLDPDFLSEFFGKRVLKSPLIKGSYGIDKVFYGIYEEMCGERLYSNIVCDCIIVKTLACIYQNEESEIPDTAGSSQPYARYKQLLEMISERYSSVTFDEAAEFMCLSRPYFSKYFRKLSGMTFTDYVNSVRINEALRLISQGELTITEISMKTGFGTIRNFNRVFKEITGYNPKSLPKDNIFIGTKTAGSDGFDPTLSAIVLI